MALGRKVGLLRDGLRTENLSQLVPGAINSISDVAQDAIQGAVDVQEQLGLVRYFLLNGRNTLTLHVLDLHLSNTKQRSDTIRDWCSMCGHFMSFHFLLYRLLEVSPTSCLVI